MHTRTGSLTAMRRLTGTTPWRGMARLSSRLATAWQTRLRPATAPRLAAGLSAFARLGRSWWPYALLIALGALAGLGYALATEDSYTARAYVAVVPREAGDSAAAVGFAQAYARIDPPADADLGSVSASSSPDAPIVELAASSGDPGRAADLANAAAAILIRTGGDRAAQTRMDLVLLSAAAAPTSPTSAQPGFSAAIGAGVGVLLGGVWLAFGGRRARAGSHRMPSAADGQPHRPSGPLAPHRPAEPRVYSARPRAEPLPRLSDLTDTADLTPVSGGATLAAPGAGVPDESGPAPTDGHKRARTVTAWPEGAKADGDGGDGGDGHAGDRGGDGGDGHAGDGSGGGGDGHAGDGGRAGDAHRDDGGSSSGGRR